MERLIKSTLYESLPEMKKILKEGTEEMFETFIRDAETQLKPFHEGETTMDEAVKIAYKFKVKHKMGIQLLYKDYMVSFLRHRVEERLKRKLCEDGKEMLHRALEGLFDAEFLDALYSTEEFNRRIDAMVEMSATKKRRTTNEFMSSLLLAT